MPTRAWAWIPLLTCLLAGCARTYDAVEPRVVHHEAINVVASGLRVAPPMIGTVVDLRTGARADTTLRGARLAPLSAEPCSSPTKFVRLEEDGIEKTEGPLAL